MDDLTAPERREQRAARSLADLRASGPLGRWLAEHLGKRRRP
nr:hypothetical protein [uncultured Holophaga sp.]